VSAKVSKSGTTGSRPASAQNDAGKRRAVNSFASARPATEWV
jgi:hypothetical protein